MPPSAVGGNNSEILFQVDCLYLESSRADRRHGAISAGDMQSFLNLYDVRLSHSSDSGSEEVKGVPDRFAEERRECLIRARHKATSRYRVHVDGRL